MVVDNSLGCAKKRRFKKRGGAKKKKKKTEFDSSAVTHENGSNVAEDLIPHQPYGSLERGKTAYISPVQPSSTLEASILSYVLKIQDDLNQLTGGQMASAKFSLLHAEGDTADLPSPPVLLSRNALSDLQPKMHEVAMDPSGSRLLETLIQFANDTTLVAKLLSTLLSLGPARIAVLAQHRCGSHVFEALVSAVSSSVDNDSCADTAMMGIVSVLKDWDGNTLVTLMNNPSGSHVLRVIYAALTGIPVAEPRKAKIDDSESGRIRPYFERLRKTVPKEWSLGVEHSVQYLINIEDSSVLESLPWETASCTVLQSLVTALACVDIPMSRRLAKAVIGSQVSTLVSHPIGSRFVERAVSCLGPDIVWSEVKGRLRELISDRCGNYVAQSIFLGLKKRSEISAVWDEVEDMLPSLLGIGAAREGVVLALLRATEIEGDDSCQRRANRCLTKGLGTTGAHVKDLIGVLLTGSFDTWGGWRDTIRSLGKAGLGIQGKPMDTLQSPRSLPHLSTIGMLIARCLLRYNGAAGQNARDAMANFSQLEIFALCGNPVGSRLLEQWVDLDVKNAVKLLNAVRAQGSTSITGIAKSPYGTHLLSRCVPRVPKKLQKDVMDKLVEKCEELKSHRFGAIAIRKCRVEQYRRGANWMGQSGAAHATRVRVFSEIIDETNFDRGQS